MRHFYLFIAAVTAFAIAALTQPAQAMYHPTMGRFLQRDPIGYSDGMNLYEYVKSTPCDATDAYGEKAVKGNEWGDWEVVQESHSGGDPLKAKFGKGAYYWSDMTAFFVPNAKKVCCDVIAFIQILRRTSSTTGANMNPTYVVKRQTESGWAVDSPKLANSPWYGYDNEGNPLPPTRDPTTGRPLDQGVQPGSSPRPYRKARFHDQPSGTFPNKKYEFQLWAICKNGKDAGLVYAGLRWGFDVDGYNQLTNHDPQNIDLPGKVNDFKPEGKGMEDLIDSGEQWNKQATGPENQRNAPGQEGFPRLMSPAGGY